MCVSRLVVVGGANDHGGRHGAVAGLSRAAAIHTAILKGLQSHAVDPSPRAAQGDGRRVPVPHHVRAARPGPSQVEGLRRRHVLVHRAEVTREG